MKTTACLFLLTAVFCCNPPAHAVSIPTVPVDNPGNTGDPQPQGTFGSVGYNYEIAAAEVTNSQYTEFLNSVDPSGANSLALYNASMSSNVRGGINFNGGGANGSKYEIKPGRDNQPVVYVSWYDALRFTNWLHNGQGGSNTEDGGYTLLGGTAVPSNIPARNLGARWWLPSEDEWHKAAYHKNDGVTGNYWDYPTSTDTFPYSAPPPGSSAPTQSNTANIYNFQSPINGYNDGYAVTGSGSFNSSQNYFTNVGAYTLSTSPYGTFDQGGNAWEWTDAIVSGGFPVRRGGSWGDFFTGVSASVRVYGDRLIENDELGFRVARVPEPATMSLGSLAIVALLRWRNRRVPPMLRSSQE